MSIIMHPNPVHQKNCYDSEILRQNAVDAAMAAQKAGGPSATATAAIKAAEVAHYNRLAASALANGLNSAVFVEAARLVGTHA